MGRLAFWLSLIVAAQASGETHWALRPLARPAVPGGNDVHPIDAFVRMRLSRAGLAPSSPADRITQIRRLSFSLRGLPPSIAEIDAFVADQSPLAYEKLVDRFLASPDFGERFATPWLDLVHHADSDGFELDGKRKTAWRYRDWVIDALNSDMPFDRFVRLQLAADELGEEPSQRAALGFLRAGPSVANERTEAVRMDELDDIVRTTTETFLALTVGCARCHDHKTDAIPTEDYYRLVAVFAPSRPGDVSLVSVAEIEWNRQQTAAIEAQLDFVHNERLALERISRELDSSASELALLHAARDEYRARSDQLATQMPALPPEGRGVVESGKIPDVYVLERGDVNRKRQRVAAGPPGIVSGKTITFTDPPAIAKWSGYRRALAEWLTNDARHLLARVQVNRIWQAHFGTGIVPTASDFGATGESPANADLLEWLASEFIARGWSQKAIHRLIVTSEAYRQTSQIRVNEFRLDPSNRLLWRYPARRLEAEMIRDAILSNSDTLNGSRGGEPVFPPIDTSLIRTGNLPRWPLNARDGPDVWRRSIYVFRMRSIPFPFFQAFDAPDRALPCPARTPTITPNQSLALWNDPAILAQSRKFSERIRAEVLSDRDAQITLAFRIATGRAPTETQRLAARRYLESGADLDGLCGIIWNSNAFLFLD